MNKEPAEFDTSPPLPWSARLIVGVMSVIAIGVIWVSNSFLTERFTEDTRRRAELRQVLYAGAVQTELQRNAVVPLLLARDPLIIGALRGEDFAATSQRLITFVEEIGAKSLVLSDAQGRIVAATEREQLGGTHIDKASFQQALSTEDTVFTVDKLETGASEFSFSRAVRDANRTLGVLTVEVDLAQFEQRWRGSSEVIAITNASGVIILSTEPKWRGKTLDLALRDLSAPSAIDRAIQAAGSWAYVEQGFFSGDAIMQTEARIPFRGWRLTSFTTYASVRERVNGVLALEITGFALLLAGVFYVMSRRAQLRSLLFQRESQELRRLNLRLNREIAERQKMQETLREAEASLAQSSKLAVLGEMSAAVSHELNQPLAAMKTYMAGARLLLERRRTQEALSSFQRIDDLIERMGAITRQLKSYARKGGDDLEPVDLREAIAGGLGIMEPQLKQEGVTLSQVMPDRPVIVTADRLRLEQVVINLVRNALDAMRGVEEKELDIILSQGHQAVFTVRDSGPGIEDLGNLFEPFFTTKKPGEGVGLGLAISSSIIADLGGRLSARNSELGGAVFEVSLPILNDDTQSILPST